MATLELEGDALVVRIHGWDKLLALRSTLTLPLAEVRAIVARPPDARYDEMPGLRLAGGHWPSSFAAGYFWVTGGPHERLATALEKLQSAQRDLAMADDEDGPVSAAAKGVDAAAAKLTEKLAALGAPQASHYLAFYDVHDPTKTVGPDVTHGRLKRVVIELDQETPEACAARIGAVLASRSG